MTLEQIRELGNRRFRGRRPGRQTSLAQPSRPGRPGRHLHHLCRRQAPAAPLGAAWRRAPAGTGGAQHVEAAAIIEFIHTATLLHDDVVDGSSLRRGRDTANEVFGNATSVLVGDFLYSRAFQMMVALDRMRIMDIMADATNAIAEGEVLQLMNARDPNTTEERYIDVIHRKTARLFQAGAQIGAVLERCPGRTSRSPSPATASTSAPPSSWSTMRSITRPTKPSLGKHLGDDLAEGKPTLPLIYAMQHGRRRPARDDPPRHRGRRPRALARNHPRRCKPRGACVHCAPRSKRGQIRRLLRWHPFPKPFSKKV